MRFLESFKKTAVPAALLSSLIVGAGIFSLPYIFVRAGTVYGILLMVFFAWVMSVLHSRYAEIIDRDDGKKRFVGYAKEYLGNKGYIFGLIFAAGGIAFTLSVYLALAPSFYSLIFSSAIPAVAVFIFWIIGSVLTLLGLKKAAPAGIIIFLAMVLIIVLLGIFSFLNGNTGNIVIADLFNPANLILPFGPLLFSFAGRSALSSIRDNYKREDYNLERFKKAIKIGTFLPAALYILFVASVISLSLYGVTPDAVGGLTNIPLAVISGIGVLGIFSILTSYMVLGMEFLGILKKDIKLKPLVAGVIFSFIPLIIYFLGSGDFIRLVGISGGVFLAAESIMVILMGRKIFGRRATDIVLATVFILGIAYEIFSLF
ncbi:MAG: hypothetical protein M0P05_00065 [Candidatus Colwellbacteria bacterium]|nr:hypothetical protein [Candidatus Colwellbacteria bacterium]